MCSVVTRSASVRKKEVGLGCAQAKYKIPDFSNFSSQHRYPKQNIFCAKTSKLQLFRTLEGLVQERD
jgi:hypothetical protein